MAVATIAVSVALNASSYALERENRENLMLAPRPLFINQTQGDWLFSAASVDRCVALALPVYKLFGADQNIAVVHPPGPHDFPEEARMAAYKFIDKALKPVKPQQ